MIQISNYLTRRRNTKILHWLLFILCVALFFEWQFMVRNFSMLLVLTSRIFSNSAGISIIALTIIVRLCLTPLIFMGHSKSGRETRLAKVYSKYEKKYHSYDVPTLEKLFTKRSHLRAKIGVHHPIILYCLPLVIEIYILDMFYQAVKLTPALSHNTFIGMAMNHQAPTIWLPLLAAVLTFSEELFNKISQHQHNRLSRIILVGYPLWVLWMGHSVHIVLIVYWIGIYSAILAQSIVFYLVYRKKHPKELLKDKN